MSGSGKRVPAGWSFIGGILLGALAVRARPAQNVPSGTMSAMAAVTARQSAPVVSQNAAPAGRAVADGGEDRRIAGHSELTLQLD